MGILVDRVTLAISSLFSGGTGSSRQGRNSDQCTQREHILD